MRSTLLCWLHVASVLSVVINGGDYGGADLVPNDGDELNGAFTNVGMFRINVGDTVTVTSGATLSVTACAVAVLGVLDASAAGFAGGAAGVSNSAGGDGSGPGGGRGGGFGPNVHGPGGAGGGYGGDGGNGGRSRLTNPPEAVGGAAYGSATPATLFRGSGGGGTAKHGCCGDSPGRNGGAGDVLI